MFKRWSQYAGAIVALLLVSGLALLIVAVGANFLQNFSTFMLTQAEWTKTNTVQAAFTIRSIMNAYYILFGVIFLGFFLLMENRLITTGIPKKLVLKRTFLTLGIELVILAAIQLAMLTYMPSASSFHILLIVVLALASAGLIYLGSRKTAVSHGQ